MPVSHANGNIDTYNEKTEVVYGINNTTVTILQFLYNSILELNICVDQCLATNNYTNRLF